MRGRHVKRLFCMNPQFDSDTLAQRGFAVAPGLIEPAELARHKKARRMDEGVDTRE